MPVPYETLPSLQTRVEHLEEAVRCLILGDHATAELALRGTSRTLPEKSKGE